ncbi:MAG: DUF3048 domain-containing protein [Acidimicrobiales bacterium]|nr:DUF3048 domain-containing protein [Acidimicrobiales bacterium]
MRRLAVALVAASLVVGACSSGGDKEKASTTTTRAAADATTTIAVDPDVAPLTGLPADAAVRNRPALVVKIDNYAAKSYPQFGVGAADIVICEGVEGGITRLAAIFHSKDAPTVGPVRSARSSDLHFAVPLGRALFAYSGTNGNFQKLIAESPLIDLSPGKLPGGYTRNASRAAPYNLFSSTAKFYGAAPSAATAAKPLFSFASESATAEGSPVFKLDLFWKMPDRATRTDVSWTWNGGKPNRVQAGQATTDANGPAVAPRNVVVLFVEYADTGERDQSKSIVPEAKLEGSGQAWVVRDGKLVKGTWTKTSNETPIVLRDDEGKSIDLLPGQTWVEMPAPGNASVA